MAERGCARTASVKSDTSSRQTAAYATVRAVSARRIAAVVTGAANRTSLQRSVSASEARIQRAAKARQKPTLGSRAQTIRERFANDEAAFRGANPLDVLAQRRFPDSTAVVAVGQQDAVFAPQSDVLAAAMSSAGMTVRRASAPGGHSWVVWRAVLTQELPWLGVRLGLTPAG